jgi:hypothetical protein
MKMTATLLTTTGSTRTKTLPSVRCVRCCFPSSFSLSVVRDGLLCGDKRRRRRNEIRIIQNAFNNGEASFLTREEEEEKDDDKEDKKDAEIVQINERFHWSKKLQQKSSAETTRDDLRMMPKQYFDDEKKNEKKKTVTSTESASSFLKMQKVHRDRDTSIMVTDEQLQREFREELGEKNLEDSTTRSMRERLFLLLPSLRENSANNERLVEDLLVRVGLERVSSRLLSMRKIFPACDVAEMASKNPKVYLSFSSSGNSNSNTSGEDDEVAEKEWQTEIEKLKDMFPFAGQNGLPSVDRMVQAVPQFLDSQFVQRSIQALIFSGVAKDEFDAKTKLHQNPRLVLNVESASNRSRFESASHFDQTNVKKNKVVYYDDDNDDAKREAYYDVAS